MTTDRTAGACRICAHGDGNRTHTAREMMFGLREEFDYVECASCGCLQIAEIPEGMERYYPETYYSMSTALPKAGGVVRRGLYALEARFRLHVSNRLLGRSRRTRIFDWVRETGCDFDSSILDVGCGRGKLLHELHLFGFRNLTGVDPFVSEPLRYDNGIVIHKCELEELEGRHDLIMMHHTLEHMADPEASLSAAAERLRPGGHLLVRIPLADSHAWRHYGVHWFALDAPRHFYLHTERSMALLARRCGLEVERVVRDSGPHQFWGSEQYLRDIPHRSAESHEESPARSMFSKRQIREYARRADELNARGDGDAACFYLKVRA